MSSTKLPFLSLGTSALLSFALLGCDQAETSPERDAAPATEAKSDQDKNQDPDPDQDQGPQAKTGADLARVVAADCEATMQECRALDCASDDQDCEAAHQVCESKLGTMCELVEMDAEAELAPCTEGTRCELMAAIHACFKASMGCGSTTGAPGDDCKLKSLAKLPDCLAKAMKDHGGDCGGCPGGGGAGCDDCEETQGPDDGGCLLDPGNMGSCPAGGCLLKWVKSMTQGHGGCLLDWLGKAGKGCPGCEDE